jgi:hypothetical protein
MQAVCVESLPRGEDWTSEWRAGGDGVWHTQQSAQAPSGPRSPACSRLDAIPRVRHRHRSALDIDMHGKHRFIRKAVLVPKRNHNMGVRRRGLRNSWMTAKEGATASRGTRGVPRVRGQRMGYCRPRRGCGRTSRACAALSLLEGREEVGELGVSYMTSARPRSGMAPLRQGS